MLLLIACVGVMFFSIDPIVLISCEHGEKCFIFPVIFSHILVDITVPPSEIWTFDSLCLCFSSLFPLLLFLHFHDDLFVSIFSLFPSLLFRLTNAISVSVEKNSCHDMLVSRRKTVGYFSCFPGEELY